jgi:hypothetical protein
LKLPDLPVHFNSLKHGPEASLLFISSVLVLNCLLEIVEQFAPLNSIYKGPECRCFLALRPFAFDYRGFEHQDALAYKRCKHGEAYVKLVAFRVLKRALVLHDHLEFSMHRVLLQGSGTH